MMSVAVSSSLLLRTVFMALKPSPTVWVPAGARPGKDIGPERGRLAGPGRAAGGTGTCFTMKIGMMIISKKGTENTRDIGIENGTGTTEKGVWWEANVF